MCQSQSPSPPVSTGLREGGQRDEASPHGRVVLLPKLLKLFQLRCNNGRRGRRIDNKRLMRLDLSYNALEGGSAALLAKMVATCPQMRELNLAHNQISGDGATRLMQVR